jgi:hypothetical protein
MIRRAIAAALFALTLAGCATSGFTPAPSMPAARAGLRPEYRIFYDALNDYGDWTLIEPYGWVFHPRGVDYGSWRPYTNGFWAPSDSWGWVWISAEPFGWATYHYGSWLFDRYQGWVWVPGVEWAPAWVDWQLAGDYAGWAPLGPQGTPPLLSGTQGASPYVYAPLSSLTATDLNAHLASPAEAASIAREARPVETTVTREGVRTPFGPPFARVERAQGGMPLQRVSIQEMLPRGEAGKAAAEPAPASPPAPSSAADAAAARVEATRRAGEEAADRARAAIGKDVPPPARVPVVRPAWIHRAEAAEAKTKHTDAARDTTR